MAKKTVEKEKRYSEKEIIKMVRDSKKLPFEVKNDVLCFVNGIFQALYNMQDNPEKYMKMTDYPDIWQEGHNAIVERYQKATY